MINLLPPELKQSYRYAHANVRLLRWVTLSIVALIGLAVISVGGILFLQHSTDNYRSQVATTQEYLKAQDQKATQAKVAEMSNNLKLVTQVLSREVLFSKLLTRLGSVMPSNVIMDNLSITQTTGAINLSAKATDYQAATQVQVNLADPANKIFSKADIVSINCEGDNSNPKYPCRVIIKALFSDNNPFLFINNGKDSPS